MKRKKSLKKNAKNARAGKRMAKRGKKAQKRRSQKTNVDFFFEGGSASVSQLVGAIKLVQVKPILTDVAFRKKLAEKLGISERQLLDAAKKSVLSLGRRRRY